MKCWNQCFVYFFKKYFPLNQTNFRSSDIVYMVLKISIHRYTGKGSNGLPPLGRKQTRSTNESLSTYLTYFRYYVDFIWQFFSVGTYKYLWSQFKEFKFNEKLQKWWIRKTVLIKIFGYIFWASRLLHQCSSECWFPQNGNSSTHYK